ncbi:MAG: PAS domain S-box protein [Smithella sp.]
MERSWSLNIFPLSAESFSRLAIILVFIISISTLLGWMIGIDILKSINPHFTAMRVVTALCFLLSAAALVFIKNRSAGHWQIKVSRLFSAAVSIIGLLTVICYLVELQTGHEWAWAHNAFLNFLNVPADRMAIITAILFSIFGFILILLSIDSRHATNISHALLLPITILTYLMLVGYIFNVKVFYEWLQIAVALNTVIAFCFLCIASFCIHPESWLMKVFTGDESGAIMARRLLPAFLTLPIIIGWLRIQGERTDVFGSDFGVALVAVTYAICFFWLVWFNARSVNRTDQIRRQAQEALHESEVRYRLLFAQAAVGIKRMDVQGRMLEVNDKLCDILGYSRPELLLLSLANITHPDDLAGEQVQLERLLAGQINNYSIEKRCLRKDGSVIWVKVTSSLPSVTDPSAKWWISVVEDITNRKQAEDALNLMTAELARSNKDLEQFAYIASHDLQEPLRAVAGFMGILKKKYQDKLDDDARKYIDYAVEGAERMQTLINGLLAYSRVGTRGEDLKPMSMQTVFYTAINNLQVAIDESKAVITHDELPDITADAAQMTQLQQNLIANAIKFCDKGLPEIHLIARREDQHWVFGIRDNGIGIETQYFERIFLIFQRLHTRNQYPGTGIGLALCKKIVERHAGRIWVESEPGCGSTFYFTIPDKGDNK